MASTIQTKLGKLIDTKNNIRQTLISLGADVPINIPFANYPDIISQLSKIEFPETTTDQDLLQLLDLYRWLGTDDYKDHIYTDEEIQRVTELLNRIVEGVSEVPDVPSTNKPWMVILSIGRTTYYPGEVFSLDGYIIRVVYPDGTVVDATSKCSFTPVRPLMQNDNTVTINCAVDEYTFEYSQSISVVNLLKYIESTGTQYIKLGLLPTNISRIDASFEFRTVDGSWRTVFFTELNGSPYNGMGLRANTSSMLSFTNGSGSSLSPITAEVNTKYDFEWHCKLDSNNLILNGTTYTIGAMGSTASTELYLFANNVAGSPSQYGMIRLYYIKFYDLNNKLVKNLIPVKDAAGIVCLRDKIENKYLYNNGSGVFNAGPETQITEEV